MLQHEIMVPSATTLNNEERPLESTFEFDSDRNCYDDLMLKQELKQAAEHCQHLAEKLCKNDGSTTPRKKQQNVMITSPDAGDLSECCREHKLKLKATVAENIRLRQVLKDVTEINKRWQKYNKQQKDYIQRLQLQNNVDVLQSSQARSSSSEEEHFKVKGETQLMDQAATLSSLKNSYENAVKENCRLHKELMELKKKEDEREETKEKERVETKKEYWNQEANLREAQEQAELLKIQARTHKEDWQAEKAEKEEAKRKVQDAEEELLELRTKCQVYQLRLQKIQDAIVTLDGSGGRTHEDGWRPLRRTSSAAAGVNLKQSSLPSQNNHNGQQLRIVARGVSSREPQNNSVGDVELDNKGPTKRAAGPLQPLQRNSPPPLLHRPIVLNRELSSFEMVEDNLQQDVVSCPGCEMNFTSEQHLMFLDHFEECQKFKHGFEDCVSD